MCGVARACVVLGSAVVGAVRGALRQAAPHSLRAAALHVITLLQVGHQILARTKQHGQLQVTGHTHATWRSHRSYWMVASFVLYFILCPAVCL